MPVDHPRDQQPAADLEEQVILAALVLNVAVAFASRRPSSSERLLGRMTLRFVTRLPAPYRVARDLTSARR